MGRSPLPYPSRAHNHCAHGLEGLRAAVVLCTSPNRSHKRCCVPPHRARIIRLASSANHVIDDELECLAGTEAPVHRMSWHRSQLFSAMGAEAMHATVPQLDMWRLTADQGENCAKVHCDELYVPNGEGFVSRAVRTPPFLDALAE